MKRMLNVKLAILAIILAFGFVMVSCTMEEETPTDPLFENNRNYSIRVSNLSKEPLVAYKGSLAKENRIGGIPAESTNHGLKNDKKFFTDGPTSFRMLFITKDQYNKNKNKPEALNNQLFTSTYIFWNGSAGDNSKVYEISDKLGGDYKLQIWNTSNFNVEFRESGTSGPTIGYAPSGMTQSFLNVGAGDYLIFPVFQRYNQRRDMMETIIPMTSSGVAYRYEFGFEPSAPAGSMQMLNLYNAVSNVSSLKSGVVALWIFNGSSTGIRFYKGSFPMLTPGGLQIISAGNFQEYSIDMPKSGEIYASSLPISGYSITQGGFPANLKTTEGATNFSVSADNLYIIRVTGSYEDNDLTATIELRSGQPDGPVPFTPEVDGPGTSAGITGLTPGAPS